MARSMDARARTMKRRLPIYGRKAVRAAVKTTQTFASLILFVGAAVATGLFTSWYAINQGLAFNTERAGPWVLWTYAAAADYEPYTRARFVSLGSLTLSADRVLRYEARVDNEGRRLHSSCVYAIEGGPLNTSWWTLGVFDGEGRLIPNPAERYGFNRTTVARNARGRFRITLARDAQPGNWIPTASAGRMVLILEALEPDLAPDETTISIVPPTIRRVSC